MIKAQIPSTKDWMETAAELGVQGVHVDRPYSPSAAASPLVQVERFDPIKRVWVVQQG
jgi:hypothetical protein